jgi:hypothetical protein
MGQHDRLDAVAEIQLLQDVRDVGLDRCVADVELLCDLRIRVALRDQPQDLPLAVGQLVEPGRRRGAGRP